MKKSKAKKPSRLKGVAEWAIKIGITSPYAVAAVVIILIVMGIISVVLWFFSPVFRFMIYVVVAAAIPIFLHKTLIVKEPKYLIGAFIGVLALFVCAGAFMSVFPESGMIPVKAGAEIPELAEVEFATGQLIFLASTPIIASLLSALITKQLKGKRLYLAMGMLTLFVALFMYCIMWVT